MKQKVPQYKSLVTWDKRHEKLIARYITEYMNILNLKDGKVQTSQGYLLDAYRRILSQYVEMEGIDDLASKMQLLFRTAFLRLKKYKLQNIHMFRRALETELRHYLRNPINEYWVLLPLHATDLELCAYTLNVSGREFVVQDWDMIRKHSEFDVVLEDARFKVLGIEQDLLTKFTPIMILTEGRTVTHAYDTALRSFDLLRHVLNLRASFERYEIQVGRPTLTAKYLSAPIHVVFSTEGRLVEPFWESNVPYRILENCLSPSELLDSIILVNDLTSRASKGSTSRLLISAIEKYGRAIETTEWPLAFLALWQILESVSFSRGGEKTVINRNKILLGKNSLRKDLLEISRQTRNSLVHTGEFSESQGILEVQMLKSVVDLALKTLLGLRKELPTEKSLEYYFERESQGTSDLKEQTRVTEYILTGR